MSFNDFKNWLESNKWTSALLIILFVFGLLFQATDIVSRARSYIFGNADFQITSLEISKKHSVYRDRAKVKKKLQPYYKPTQFNEVQYRQIVFDAGFVDDLRRKGNELPQMALMITAFALDYMNNLHSSTKKLFNKFENDDGNKELIEFVFSMVPTKRFIPTMDDRTPNPYVLFLPNRNNATNSFQKAIDLAWSDDGNKTYRLRNNPIKRSTLEAFLEEYAAIFKLGFLPVFEITLFNTGTKNLLINEVGAEVLDIAEYLGGAEHIPTSDVITIPIEYKKGDNWKALSDPIVLKAGSHLRLLIRLEPQEKQSSYLVKLKVKAGDLTRVSEVIAVDM